MTTNKPIIRPATPADWPRLWPIVRTVIQERETYAYDPALTSEQARDVWTEPSPGRTVVAEADGQLLGTAKMGPNRPGPGAHIGTASFMVDPAARGRGVGQALGEYVIEWHRAQGYAGIQFNAVVETNTAAVRLWQRLGFEVLATVPGAFRSPTHGDVGLHLMFLDLRT